MYRPRSGQISNRGSLLRDKIFAVVRYLPQASPV